MTVADSSLLNYEAATNHSITVRATSADGSSATQNFTITLTDVNESAVSAVTDSDSAANFIVENSAIGSVVGITGLATDADGTDSVSYSLDNDAGGRFAINATTGVVTVAGAIDREAASSYDITVRATSTDGSSTTQIFTIQIGDVDEFNVGPVADTNATANSVTENASIGTAVGITASASDADATTSAITYSLVNNDGGRFAIDPTTGVVTVAGAIDREADGPSRSITVRATSQDGSFTDQAFSITIVDADEFDVTTPVDNNPAVNIIAENSANGTVVGITALASDADATTNAITYSLDDDAGGRFTINTTTGVVTVADSSLLNYEAATNHTIVIRATSADGSSATQNFTITLTDVNEFGITPVTDSNAAADFVLENSAIGSVVGITGLATDADGTDSVSYSLDNDAGGRFAINATTGVVTVAGAIDREAASSYDITVRATSTDGSSTTQIFTIQIGDVDEFNVGPVADTNATANSVTENASIGTAVGITASASDADATTSVITYSLVNNDGGRFAIDPTTGVVTVAGAIDREADGPSRSITVRATSQDGSFTDQTFSIAIVDADEFDVSTPTDTDPTANAVNENVAIGTTVGITANAFDLDATTNTITYSLTSNPGGLFQIDANTGVVTTAASIDRETVGGIRSITVQALSSDGSTSTQTFNITINDIDEFDVTTPTDTNNAVNQVDENVAIGTTVGITANAFDLDATTNTITYSLTSNLDGLFQIDANTGVITTAAAIDRELHGATRSVTVQALSSDGSTATQTFSITINDLNEFNISAVTDADATANAVNENVAIGTTVGITANAFDLDATTNTITYSLTSNPGGLFQIDANTGVVTTAASIDRETVGGIRSITVQALSSDGSTSTQTFNITINDIDEFDVTTPTDNNPAVNTIAENSANGTVVGITALASDADATTNAITYSLDDDAGGRFTINATTGVVTVADSSLLNYEAATNHSITVRATSADGSSATQNFTITLTDVNESAVSAVTDSDSAANFIVENSAIGSVVGITGLATDADGTDSVSYSLDNDAGGRFAINATTGVVTVAGAIDREAASSYDITVRATSTDGSSTTQIFTIQIGDVDEFNVGPVADTNATANSVTENASIGTAVGITASASDADATTSAITYSLVNNDGGRFAIDPTTGVVTVAGAIDREADGPSRSITVRATSQDGSFTDQTFSIAIVDADEFDVTTPTDSNPTVNTIAENSANGTVVGITALASDADATTNAITYSLDDDAGGRFTINTTTGVVTVADSSLLNYEAATNHTIVIRATSADGSSATQNFTITLTDVNEFGITPVTDSNAAADFVLENSAIGSVVGITGLATDADGTDSVSYSLDNDAGGRFAINATTGVVTVAGAIDREAASSYNITVRATSTDGSSTTQIFTIQIGDVDEFNVGPVADTSATANSVTENASIGTAVGITPQPATPMLRQASSLTRS